ncbi:hypothetical protein OH77DRAFT_1431165 [Trametes cingulata]|nr:hypothetical protein OH77DRAFT_1431165 [Trametes cingulata]
MPTKPSAGGATEDTTLSGDRGDGTEEHSVMRVYGVRVRRARNHDHVFGLWVPVYVCEWKRAPAKRRTQHKSLTVMGDDSKDELYENSYAAANHYCSSGIYSSSTDRSRFHRNKAARHDCRCKGDRWISSGSPTSWVWQSGSLEQCVNVMILRESVRVQYPQRSVDMSSST